MATQAARATPEQKLAKQKLRNLQRAANDDSYNTPSAQKVPQGQPSAEKMQRIQTQYAQDAEMQQARTLQAQQAAVSKNRPRKKGRKLTRKQRLVLARAYKTVAKYENGPWIMMFVIAFAADTFDILAAIPIIGLFPWVFSGILKLCVTIFVWTKTNRVTRKLLYTSVIMFIDQIPFIGIIPFVSITLGMLFYHLGKKALIAKKRIKKYAPRA